MQRQPARLVHPVGMLFQQAVAHHTSGRLAEAEALYRQIVATTPNHADSLHLLGVLAYQAGQNEAAVDMIGQAIRLRSSVADYHGNLGNALRRLGRFQEAAASYRRALQRRPGFPEMHYNLGNTLRELGQREAAVLAYRKAIALKRHYPDAHNNLGNTLRELGQPEQAAASFRAALQHAPGVAEFHFNLALALGDARRLKEAADALFAALQIRRDYPEALLNLGKLLSELGRTEEAAECFRATIRLDPESSEAHYLLGNALLALFRLDDAESSYRAALRLRPDHLECRNNLGVVLTGLGFLQEAEVELRSVLAVNPELPEAHNNLGNALRDANRLEEAEVAFQEALRIRPDYPEARASRGTTRLLAGRFAEGWPDYEYRWGTTLKPRGLSEPRWEGEELKDRTLLVYAEQGIGDTIQFCRYLPLACAHGRVVFEVQRPLLRLLGTLDGPAELVAQGDPLPSFDVQCPLMSLPMILGTTAETIPNSIPYLHVDPDRVAAWRAMRSPLPGLAVGLAWAGNQAYALDRKRSMAWDQLAPLLEMAGVSFVSLQKNAAVTALSRQDGLHDWTEELDDFADTAALMASLDLVISVDTAVAHLAGALGQPVWLLNRFDTCWRWLLGRDDSPWYPTLRQFRQPRPRDWASVVFRVRTELQRIAVS